MANTLYAAVKVYLEAQGLGITVYRDAAPEGVSRPYVIFLGDIAQRLEPLEDGAASTGAEEIQLELWETWRATDDKSGESPTLADAITQKLQGTSLTPYGTAKKQVYGMLQKNRSRTPYRNERLVRHLYQVDVMRVV